MGLPEILSRGRSTQRIFLLVVRVTELRLEKRTVSFFSLEKRLSRVAPLYRLQRRQFIVIQHEMRELRANRDLSTCSLTACRSEGGLRRRSPINCDATSCARDEMKKARATFFIETEKKKERDKGEKQRVKRRCEDNSVLK